MNNLPATREPSTLQGHAAPSGPTGYEDIPPEELMVFRLRLVQPQTSDLPGNPPKGSLFLSGVQRAFEKVECVPMQAIMTRVAWDQRDPSKPVCASNNGKVPRGDIEEPFRAVCEGCPAAQWGEDGEPPQCSARYTILFVDRAHGMPFIVDFSKTSYRAGRALVSIFAQQGIPLCDYPVTLSSTVMTKNNRSFYAWTYTLDQWSDPQERQMFHDLFLQFRQADVKNKLMGANLTVNDEEDRPVASDLPPRNELQDIPEGDDDISPW
jgi:hypothetical protein